MTGKQTFKSLALQVGIISTIRAAWASRGKGLTGFCRALADQGFSIWYDSNSCQVKAARFAPRDNRDVIR